MGNTWPRVHAHKAPYRGTGVRIAAVAAALALLVVGLAPAAAAQTESQTVSIPDPGLRSAIEDALGKQSGQTITQAEMARLTVLDASHSDVRQIDGLEHAVNLHSLYLQGNRIEDASSLTSLSRMQVLVLHSNDISEIDLTQMTNLKFVDLGNNQLATIDLSGQRTRVGENARSSVLYALWLNNNRLGAFDLSGLTALRDRPDGASHPNYVSLRLDRNQLTSVTGLGDLPRGVWSLRLEHNRLTSLDLRGAEHLHYLYLHHNPISSTSDLAGFSALTGLRRLHLYETEISTIDLSRFSRLERTFLNDNNLTSVDVTGLDSIQRLWLRGNRITRISGLPDVGDTLRSLNLRSNRLSSIDLSRLPGLRQLYLSDNRLASVDVSLLTQLQVLWLHNGVSSGGSPPNPAYENQITTLGQLPRFLTDLRLAGNPLSTPISVASRSGLRRLYVSGGQIQGVSEVAGLTGLTELGLEAMDLDSSDLAGLSRLTALQRLHLRGNSITSVSALARLGRLTELRLDGNSVSDVSPLASLTALRDLYVAGNLVTDFAPLRELIVAGLTIHGGGGQRGESPDNFFWDLNSSGSIHGWNLGLLAADGILENTECGLDLICPGLAVERWVLAIWLVRVLDGEDPEPLGYNRFEDVHPGLQWAAHVERLAELGITQGCSSNPARFCPQDPVSRAQMASLLASTFNLQTGTQSVFVDVDRQSPHAASIDALAAAGVTAGCRLGPDRYCPDDLVTRGQAASLIIGARDYVAAN